MACIWTKVHYDHRSRKNLKKYLLVPTLAAIFISCGGTMTPNTQATATAAPTPVVSGGLEPAARFIFHTGNFTSLTDFVTPQSTNFKCLGDVVKNYYVTGNDYAGTSPSIFPYSTSPDQLSPTTRPTFVKNVSVDMTQTNYPNTVENVVQTDQCSYRTGTVAPTSCADFDLDPYSVPTPSPTIAPNPTPNPTPDPTPTPVPTATPEYYGTSYYRARDDLCAGQGPILSPDADTTKSYVGGVNIDLDRTQLGANEDLLMNVTYLSMNENSVWPDVGLSQNDRTILKVSLVGTGQSLDTLLGIQQPRPWSDYSSTPVYLKEIATFEDPFGSLRTEQVYLPVSQNVLIDRVRIDRIRGSYYLYQIDIYRLGNRAN